MHGMQVVLNVVGSFVCLNKDYRPTRVFPEMSTKLLQSFSSDDDKLFVTLNMIYESSYKSAKIGRIIGHCEHRKITIKIREATVPRPYSLFQFDLICLLHDDYS